MSQASLSYLNSNIVFKISPAEIELKVKTNFLFPTYVIMVIKIKDYSKKQGLYMLSYLNKKKRKIAVFTTKIYFLISKYDDIFRIQLFYATLLIEIIKAALSKLHILYLVGQGNGYSRKFLQKSLSSAVHRSGNKGISAADSLTFMHQCIDLRKASVLVRRTSTVRGLCCFTDSPSFVPLRADFLSSQKLLATVLYNRNQLCKCSQPNFNENFYSKNCLRALSAMTGKPI